MPEFHFKAVDASGKLTSGVSSAQDPEGLAKILHQQGLFLMESRETSQAGAPAATAGRVALSLARLRDAWTSKEVPLKHVGFCTAQLSIMVRSALPIVESLAILAAQASTATLKEVLIDIGLRVNEGAPLSVAFARHPRVFDRVYISLLAAGEAGGDLDIMLDRLVTHLDFKINLEQKIQSALVYPVIIVLTAMSVVAFLVVFVLPTFMEIFIQLNIELPLPTRILMFLSDILRAWWWALFLAAGAGWLAFVGWAKDPLHARTVDKVKLRLPLIGELTRNIVLTRVLRTLASLLESGVTILTSLELSKAAAGNWVFHDLLEKVSLDVRQGKVLSLALAQSPHIPGIVIGMVSTGERTGTLPEVINRVAGFYEAETDAAIKNIFTAMEPLFIIGLGITVGGIAVSVLLPMFDMAQGIR